MAVAAGPARVENMSSFQRKVRIKKLNPKTGLQVLIEGQINSGEYESLATDISSTAGVDQAEQSVNKPLTHSLANFHGRKFAPLT